MPSKPGQIRESGKTAAQEESEEAGRQLTEPVKADLPEEHPKKKEFRTPGFARMRLVWRSDDRPLIEGAQAAVNGTILRLFPDAYEVIGQVFDLVRTPEVGPDGNPLRDQFGFIIWHRNPSGSYEEDWDKLTTREKGKLLFSITTRIFEWQQRAADLWGEAMFAKAQWEERYSIAYDAPISGTIEDRNAVAVRDATEEKYFAIFQSLLSRKADALVRSMELLSQRLKDSMGA